MRADEFDRAFDREEESIWAAYERGDFTEAERDAELKQLVRDARAEQSEARDDWMREGRWR